MAVEESGTAAASREALLASEAKYHFLSETIPVQIWTSLPDGRLDYVSHQTAGYFGLTPSQLLADGFALDAEVGSIFTRAALLANHLQECAEAVVRHMHVAFARIWTTNAQGTVLELQASAGLYTHLDGAHARVPVGHLKIGQIAAERKAHFTSEVVGDPRVSDQTWRW